MTRVGFCHLICVFSLLLCQADICGSPHQTANKAAFKVNMLNIPVCCDCGTVCSHTFLGQCLRHALPSACQHSTVKGPKREYWLGVSGLPMVYLPSSAVCNLKGGADKFSWTASLWILTFFPLLSLSTTRTSIQEGSSCCETLGPASSVHHLSALSEKQQQRQKWFWTVFLSIHQRVLVILQSTKHLVWSLFAYVQHFSGIFTFIKSLHFHSSTLFPSLLPAL